MIPYNPSHYSAQVIEDSVSDRSIRLATLEVVMPRIILPEWNTHRKHSKNAASSRAIPTVNLLKQVRNDPVLPLRFGKNQKGMQASEDIGGNDLATAIQYWTEAASYAAYQAENLLELNVHKQTVNRLLEPFTTTRCLVSSTNFANFMALRDHPDAQPEIALIASLMKKALNDSKPKLLKHGDWHLPYITDEDRDLHDIIDLRRVSVARCARVSYKTHDGNKSTFADDMALFERLVGSQPLHATPAEHQATPDIAILMTNGSGREFYTPELHGNFDGWIQFRKMLPNEYVQEERHYA